MLPNWWNFKKWWIWKCLRTSYSELPNFFWPIPQKVLLVALNKYILCCSQFEKWRIQWAHWRPIACYCRVAKMSWVPWVAVRGSANAYRNNKTKTKFCRRKHLKFLCKVLCSLFYSLKKSFSSMNRRSSTTSTVQLSKVMLHSSPRGRTTSNFLFSWHRKILLRVYQREIPQTPRVMVLLVLAFFILVFVTTICDR